MRQRLPAESVDAGNRKLSFRDTIDVTIRPPESNEEGPWESARADSDQASAARAASSNALIAMR